MEPRISVVTLAVTDMGRSIRFYAEGLGLPYRDDKPPVAYFQLVGTWLALFPQDELANYAGLSGQNRCFGGITLSCNVADRDAVNQALNQAAAAGGRIIKAAQSLSYGGYAGWFADPDGHAWEITWNPNPFIA